MATASVRATPRATSPPTRRPPSSISTSATTPLARSTTARAAASPRVASSLNSPSRRSSLKGRPSSPPITGDTRETRDNYAASLKSEVEQKEQLLIQLQNKEQIISNITAENDNLTSALTAAEAHLNELYADQSRMEDEMATRIELSEKIREQVRELEKEKRDLQRRYNEQTSSFEAERQSFYDNEQHLKSRIQSLTQARKQADIVTEVPESEPELELETEVDTARNDAPQKPVAQQEQEPIDTDTEPAEMTALRLELSTLSTSYSSLQSTLMLLQSQLVDLKRVNNELQEENESYMILLREKTLSGRFDVMRQVGGTSSDGDDDSVDAEDSGDVGSLRSTGRSTLDRVDEVPEEGFDLEEELAGEHEPSEVDSPTSIRPSRHGRQRKRSRSPGAAPRGESLADLPITGPGLDLAAELGRAENKDILTGGSIEGERTAPSVKAKRSKKASDGKKAITTDNSDPNHSTNDIDALRTEVKSLKDANKALSLYASKIIDRIISQEGFEHVLAADYEKPPPTPSTAGPGSASAQKSPATPNQPSAPGKPRPQSVFVGRSTSSPGPVADTSQQAPPPVAKSASAGPPPKANRRSLSFDWKSFSMFGGGGEKKPENPNLRPLTLTPGASPMTGGRKLETQEDEDDRRERERLNATMKLMGIQPSPPAPVPLQNVEPSVSNPTPSQSRFSFFRARTMTESDDASVHSTPPLDSDAVPSSPLPVPPALERNNSSSSNPSPMPSRFSFFRARTSTDNSETSSQHSGRVGLGIDLPSGITQEALVEAEAQNSMAALDAHERCLSEEIAQGSNGGFTEIVPRSKGRALGDEWRSKRSRRSGGGSGSGSTVWSAGMDKVDDGDE